MQVSLSDAGGEFHFNLNVYLLALDLFLTYIHTIPNGGGDSVSTFLLLLL